MSEYIKISDVIKICKHLYSSFVTTAFFDTHVPVFENLLRTVAVEFPEPPESKEYCMSGWISVKDRLPEESDFYLVYIIANSCPKNRQIITLYFSNLSKRFIYGSDEIFTVTHWMLLPQPPKETDAE